MLVFSALLVACGGENNAQGVPTTAPTAPTGGNVPVQTEPTKKTSGQDEHITVQHILIGFKDAVGFQRGGSVPPKAATRTQEDARKLAYELLDRVKAGEDFGKLVKEYSDDGGAGIYAMANAGVTPFEGESARDGMVPAFGDVGFTLKIGEVGISDYDQAKSPYGYHIIKRITRPTGQDEHITVQHILVGFKDAVGFRGSAPGKAATRTQDEAKKLADELLNRAKAGEDFDKLMKENSDDTGPGTYSMSNIDVAPAGGEVLRLGMVPAFGNVGFASKVGEIGLSPYDPDTSPYGYHIIKRTK